MKPRKLLFTSQGALWEKEGGTFCFGKEPGQDVSKPTPSSIYPKDYKETFLSPLVKTVGKPLPSGHQQIILRKPHKQKSEPFWVDQMGWYAGHGEKPDETRVSPIT